MNQLLLTDLIDLVNTFENTDAGGRYTQDIHGFRNWLCKEPEAITAIDWEGKKAGRSIEGAIASSIVHLYRYAKQYSKAAIHGSDFTTQDDFIYLINLRSYGMMSKTALIKKNIHDKPTGMMIINRLIEQGWIEQRVSESDRRTRLLTISKKGERQLEKQMNKIRQATQIVTGPLNSREKNQLMQLLNKLEQFHATLQADKPEGAGLLQKGAALLNRRNRPAKPA